MSAPVPAVPQRPSRSQNGAASLAPSTTMPQVPPRPARGTGAAAAAALDRQPGREFASRSPLNDLPIASPPNLAAGLHERAGARSTSPLDTARPSITSLPLVGQEGEEYKSLEHVPQLAGPAAPQEPGTPTQARAVPGDLPLHAPKATVSSSQVTPLVRTDTPTAAEAGIGKAHTDYDEGADLDLRKTVSRPGSFRPQSSGLSRELTREASAGSNRASRPASLHEDLDERGIPHFGSYVPMYPNAGDVQAPSPTLYHHGGPGAGSGTFGGGAEPAGAAGHSSRPPTVEGRRKSVTGFHGPAGSYGLHGHGMATNDQFEKEWYKKHPDELRKDQEGAHGPSSALSRHDWAYSSDDLNRLVRENNERAMGASGGYMSVPSEAIGYQASEAYTSRAASPVAHAKSPEPTNYASSPLRHATVAGDDEVNDDVIHLDPPSYRADKYGGAGYDPPTHDLGINGGNTTERGGWIDERGAGIPILASDEVQKRPGSGYRMAAVSPEAAKHGADDYFSEYESDSLPAWQRHKRSKRSTSANSSRRSSRPSSARLHPQDVEASAAAFAGAGAGGARLNEIEEYEPLFADGDEAGARPLTAADRLKRPELERRFPSSDIWEDTPNSLQLETTVSGPQVPEDAPAANAEGGAASTHFEPPEHEAARKGEVLETERRSFLSDAVRAKPKFNAAVKDGMQRPSFFQHRFPSQDIWEDTPDSARLETTVVDDPDAANNVAQGFAAADGSLSAATAASDQQRPVVPGRPARARQADQPSASPSERRAPTVPERPKPSVPARPAKHLSPMQDGASGEQSAAPAAARAKPPVAQKGGKLSSIKASFMENLNSRLQLGPTAPSKPATDTTSSADDEDKAPLADARKGRARGPARRTPKAEAAATEEAAAPPDASAAYNLTSRPISKRRTLWTITESDDSGVRPYGGGADGATTTPSTAAPTSKDLGEVPTASPLSTNTAGEALQAPSEVPGISSGELAHKSNADMDARAAAEEEAQREGLAAHQLASVGSAGDVPEPVPEPALEDHAASKTQAREPAPYTDGAAQTGETKITSETVGADRKEEVTAFVDGGRTDGETVVVAGGHVNEA